MAIDYQGPEDSVRYDAPPVEPQAAQAQAAQAQWTQAAAAAAAAQQPMYGNGVPMATPGVPAPGAYTPMYGAPNQYAQPQFQPAPGAAVYNGPQPTMPAEPPQAFQQPQADPFTGVYANMSPGTQASQMAWTQQAGQPQPMMQQAVAYAPKSKTTAGVLGLVFGALGAHNFYLGKTGRGVAQLLITLLTGGVLAPVSAIWGLVEGICILASSPGSNWAKDGRGHDLI